MELSGWRFAPSEAIKIGSNSNARESHPSASFPICSSSQVLLLGRRLRMTTSCFSPTLHDGSTVLYGFLTRFQKITQQPPRLIEYFKYKFLNGLDQVGSIKLLREILPTLKQRRQTT
ncbi:hypothetical protein O181_033286 [Austropuccinia psidii MF-1]|uniref:Uncharacterized protein n=1 Tax=Austropuccinia psidii MF-1 TaxID=1389203 RepID=A0A9Q3H6Y4_9BASI|nr:hypothetical protein [Austropuccinia psidii MF-1]